MDIDIRGRAQRMAEKGVDARTITVNFEVELGRGLNAAESAAVVDAWRASAKARADRARAADLQAAAALRAR